MKTLLCCLLFISFFFTTSAQIIDYWENPHKVWGFKAENRIKDGTVDLSSANGDTEKVSSAITTGQSFPDKVYELKNLKVLDIVGSYNACCPVVGPISDKLNSLTKLEHIYFTGIGVTALPANLGGLTSLKSILISEAEKVNASLGTLPDFKALPSLNVIYISLNKNTALAKAANFSSVFDVPALKVLALNRGMLSGDQLSAIGNLKQLEVLELSENRLGQLPDLSGNGTLQQFAARNSELEKLGDAITRLVGLKALDLGYNKLTSLPADMGKLNKLKFLDLSYNDLTSLPASMEGLEQLESLSLRGNEITEIPSFVYKLKNLKELDLLDTKIARLDPKLLETKIQRLAISHQDANGFSFDPEMLAKMKTLKKVQMSTLKVDKDVANAKAKFKRLRPDVSVY